MAILFSLNAEAQTNVSRAALLSLIALDQEGGTRDKLSGERVSRSIVVHAELAGDL